MIHRQQGFTLTDMIFVLMIASLVFATIFTSLLTIKKGIKEYYLRAYSIEHAINDVTNKVEENIANTISTTNCLSAPPLNIAQLSLKTDTRSTLPNLQLFFNSYNTVLLNYQISFDLESEQIAKEVMQSLSKKQRWISYKYHTLTITIPVRINDSIWQSFYLNPVTGCYEL